MKSLNSGLKLISLLGILSLFAPTACSNAEACKWDPPEISFYDYVDWDIDIRSLVNVSFDTDQNGKADFIATYRQSEQEYGIDIPDISPEEIRKKYPNNKIVSTRHKKRGKEQEIDYIPSPGEGNIASPDETGKPRYRHYVLNKNPIYYVLDRNEDGFFEIIFKDNEEDGINGNEKLDYCPNKKELKLYQINNEDWSKREDLSIPDYIRPPDAKDFDESHAYKAK